MQSTLIRLQDGEDFKEGLRNVCRVNRLSITMLNGFTIKRIKTTYARTLQHYESNPEKAQSSWFENELRLFHWVLIIEAYFTNSLLNQFTQEHWIKIQTYFPPKNINIFQFQAKKLIGHHSPTYSRNWLAEEGELLTSIMRDETLINRWNDVARRFYEESDKKFYRSSKQCRQQWFNHLDFSKKHGSWTEVEDRQILQFVLRSGRKWAQICKEELPHRTEHMIKNRFKSLLMRIQPSHKKEKLSERRMIKILLSQGLEPSDEHHQKRSTAIKKQQTVSTCKEMQNRQWKQSLSASFEYQIRGNEQEDDSELVPIIIENRQQKQKQCRETESPLRPIPLSQPSPQSINILPQYSPHNTFNASMFQQPQYPPEGQFSLIPFYPPCFTFYPSSLPLQTLNDGTHYPWLNEE